MEITDKSVNDFYENIKLNRRSVVAAIEVIKDKYEKTEITINESHDVTFEEFRDSTKEPIKKISVFSRDSYKSDSYRSDVSIVANFDYVMVGTSSSLDDKSQSSRQALRDIFSPLVCEKKINFQPYAKKLIYIGLALTSPIAIIEKSVFYFFILVLLAFGLLFFEKITSLLSPDKNYLFQDEIPESEHGFIKRNIDKISVGIIFSALGLLLKWAYDVFDGV